MPHKSFWLHIIGTLLCRSSRWPESWIRCIFSGFRTATGSYSFSATSHDSKINSKVGRLFWWGNTIYIRLSWKYSHVFKEKLLASCLWYSSSCMYTLFCIINIYWLVNVFTCMVSLYADFLATTSNIYTMCVEVAWLCRQSILIMLLMILK
jgi:hypothetical protein